MMMHWNLFHKDEFASLKNTPSSDISHVRCLLVKVDTKLKDDIGKANVNINDNSSKLLNISEIAIVTFLNQLD